MAEVTALRNAGRWFWQGLSNPSSLGFESLARNGQFPPLKAYAVTVSNLVRYYALYTTVTRLVGKPSKE